MSRVNKFEEGYIESEQFYFPPAKKRKNRKKGFRLPKKIKENRHGLNR